MRLTTAALALVVCVAFATTPVAADPGGVVDIKTVSTVDDGNVTRVSVGYETTVAVKVNTYLFGSEELQDELAESVGIEEERVEFESLDTSSAEMVYDGDSENVVLPS